MKLPSLTLQKPLLTMACVIAVSCSGLMSATCSADGITPPEPVVGASVLKGDVNLDGQVDFSDIFPFVCVLQAGLFQAEADLNCDGVVNFADIPFFISPGLETS